MFDDAYAALPSSSYRCEICRSEDVMYDDEGYIVCNVCGGASQYRMLETNEGEDVQGIYSASMTIRTPKAKYKAVEKEDKKDASLYDLCRAFQYCLKLSLRSAFLMLCPSPTTQQEDLYADLLNELKCIWFAYLEAWEGIDSCEFKSSFARMLHCTCPNPSFKQSPRHPPFPSKPLLLAFVYVSMSRLSFPVLPADLVRGVERGCIPYHTLWSQIPVAMRNSIHPMYRYLWQDSIKSKTFSITPMNIFFQACQLQASLEHIYPPATPSSQPKDSQTDQSPRPPPLLPSHNLPLLIYRLVRDLGLPPVVYRIYCAVAGILRMEGGQEEGSKSGEKRPLFPFDYLQPPHSLPVAACLVMCIKMCAGWQHWDLVRTSHENTEARHDKQDSTHDEDMQKTEASPPTPEGLTIVHKAEISQWSRQQMEGYVDQLMRVYPRISWPPPQDHPFNALILTVMSSGNKGPAGEEGEQQDEQEEVGAGVPAPSGPVLSLWRRKGSALSEVLSLPARSICMHSSSYSSISRGKKRYEERLMGGIPHPAPQHHRQVHYLNGQVAYMAHIRHIHDKVGIPPPPLMILIERVSRYLYVEPGGLWSVMLEAEGSILEFAVEGKVMGVKAKNDSRGSQHVKKRGGRKKKKTRYLWREDEGGFEVREGEEGLVDYRDMETTGEGGFMGGGVEGVMKKSKEELTGMRKQGLQVGKKSTGERRRLTAYEQFREKEDGNWKETWKKGILEWKKKEKGDLVVEDEQGNEEEGNAGEQGMLDALHFYDLHIDYWKPVDESSSVSTASGEESLEEGEEESQEEEEEEENIGNGSKATGRRPGGNIEDDSSDSSDDVAFTDVGK